jgi:hypothetical protein
MTSVLGTVSHIRLSVRKNVDFPQPEGPMNAVIFFVGMTRLML